jgi:hypothetical protein
MMTCLNVTGMYTVLFTLLYVTHAYLRIKRCLHKYHQYVRTEWNTVPSWKANSRSANHDILWSLENVHYPLTRSPPLSIFCDKLIQSTISSPISFTATLYRASRSSVQLSCFVLEDPGLECRSGDLQSDWGSPQSLQANAGIAPQVR